MKLNYFELLKSKKTLLITVFSFLSIIIIFYCLLIRTPLDQLTLLKLNHQQLNFQLSKLDPEELKKNPTQRDPLIHEFISMAQANQLEITNLKFGKNTKEFEEIQCSLQGSYLNILGFIKTLFNSKQAITIKELSIINSASEEVSHYLKAKLVLESYD